MKFALFLLKDRNGVITLDVPVRGDLKDPTVKIGKIVWNTFKNLIIKVAAAPFDLLAGLLSVDPKDIKAIEYQYNDTILTAGRQRQLDLLLDLEQKKEGLEIELVYFNDPDKEKEAIAVAEAGKQLTNPVVLDSIVNLNATVRKEQIDKYLFSKNDSTGIYTTISNKDAPKNTGSFPLFEVKYSIKNKHE
jgi:hypothetical protein